MTPEARAARERKQKIFVLVGGLALLALLAFQLPRLLGGSETPAAAPVTDTAVETLPGTGTPVVLGGGAQSAETGKLRSLTTFKRKDPFVQQVKPQEAAAAAAASSAAPGVGVSKPAEGEFNAGQAGEIATVISVNGKPQSVDQGQKFPSSDPMFVLVAQQPGKKTVVIGVVGGAYSGGATTTKLRVGKPLVLTNTATGAKYKLELVSVGRAATDSPAP